MTKIIIDVREASLIQLFQESGCNFEVVIQPLEVGDIHVVNEDHSICLVFERKTLADLAASIKDGRYKEQKHRLLTAHNPKHVTYIIESSSGRMDESKYGFDKSTFQGVQIHGMYRDGIHVHIVKNVEETMQWLLAVATKVAANPAKFVSDQCAESYVSTRKAKVRRIDNITPDVCYMLQLSQIPGVSSKLAEAICAKYTSLKQLIFALSESEDPVKELCSVPLIGKKKAQTIIDYVLKE